MKAFHLAMAVTLAFAPLASAAGSAQPIEGIRETAVQEADFIALSKSAYTLHLGGKNAEAIDAVNRAEREGVSHALSKMNAVARAWNNLGITLFELGYNLRAKSAYEKALAIAKTISEPALLSHLLNNLGQVEGRLGHTKEAIEYLEACLALTRESSTRESSGTAARDLAIAMDNLATAYQATYDLDKAEDLHRKALDIFEREGGFIDPDAATAAGNLGGLYQKKGDYLRAEAYFLRAFDTHHRLRGIEHGETLLDAAKLAQLYLNFSDQTRTKQLVALLLGIGGTTPGKQHLSAANWAIKLGETAESVGELSIAERLAVRAGEIFRTVLGANDTQTLAAIDLLARIQAKKLDFTSAEKNYLFLLTAYSDQKELSKRANAAVQLAKVYRERKSYPAANEILTRTIDELRAKGADPNGLASALGNLAELYFDADKPAVAESKYGEAFAAIKDEQESGERPWLLHGRALLRYHLGKYELAQRDLEEARDLWAKNWSKEHPFVATSEANLALIAWARNDAASALEHFSQAAKLTERQLQRTLTIGTEQQRLAYARGHQDELFKILSFCFATSGCTGKTAQISADLLLQRKGVVLDAEADTLRQIREELSPDIRSLLDRLGAVRREISTKISPTLVSGELPRESAGLKLLFDEEADLEAKVKYNGVAYGLGSAPVTLEAVRSALPAGAILLEFVKYSVFEPARTGRGTPWRGERYAVLAVSAGSEPRWFDLGPAEQIESEVKAFRVRLRQLSTQYIAGKSERLSALVIAPLQKTLGVPTDGKLPLLLIAPDGLLNIVPFEVLSDRNGETVISHFLVDYLTSGRDLIRRQQSSPSNKVVVVASPDFDAQVGEAPLHATVPPVAQRSYFEPLPGTAREAEELERLLGNVVSFPGAKASVSALKSVNRPAVLHIATHGLFRPMDRVQPQVASDILALGGHLLLLKHSAPSGLENPLLYSGLALAGANNLERGASSGIISALEISGLNLQGTQLVVLSACDTGLGATAHGDEFSGLRRAFSIAGAASQVTSLWKVDDAAASTLMAYYYELLLTGTGRAEALQRAKQRIRNDHPAWRHPHFWAAFIASGDWRPMDHLDLRAK